MTDTVTVVPYDAAWPGSFALLASDLRNSMGDVAVRIDHIGSTAVPGLSAKPVVDIQVSVRSLEPSDAYRPWRTAASFSARTIPTEPSATFGKHGEHGGPISMCDPLAAGPSSFLCCFGTSCDSIVPTPRTMHASSWVSLGNTRTGLSQVLVDDLDQKVLGAGRPVSARYGASARSTPSDPRP